MTPPVRASWDAPDFPNFTEAIQHAANLAALWTTEMLVLLRINDGALGFDVMLRSSYDYDTAKMQRWKGDHAIVANLLPDGTRTINSALSPTAHTL